MLCGLTGGWDCVSVEFWCLSVYDLVSLIWGGWMMVLWCFGLLFRLVCISYDLACFAGVLVLLGWFDFDWISGRFGLCSANLVCLRVDVV